MCVSLLSLNFASPSLQQLQREENIARNKEVLRQLGLAGPTPPAKKTNGNAALSSGSRNERGATSRADSSAASRKRQRDETGKKRQCIANPSEPNGHESPGPLDLEEEDADAYYRLLLGNQPPSSMLGPELIQRAASDLGLDIENKFNANAIRLMIDVFDTQGAGRISRSDFKLLLRQVKRSKH